MLAYMTKVCFFSVVFSYVTKMCLKSSIPLLFLRKMGLYKVLDEDLSQTGVLSKVYMPSDT